MALACRIGTRWQPAVWVPDHHAGYAFPTALFSFHTGLLRPQTPVGSVLPLVAVRLLIWLEALGVLRSPLAAWPNPFPLGYRLPPPFASTSSHPFPSPLFTSHLVVSST